MSSHGRTRTRALTVALLLLVSVVFSLSGCVSPGNRARVESDLQTGFPGFRIAELEGYSHLPLPSDGLEQSGFDFELISDDVADFHVLGQYVWSLPGDRQEADSSLFRQSIFSGQKLSRSESISLQKLFVETAQGQRVRYRRDARTGLASDFKNLSVGQQYTDLDRGQVFCLDATDGRTYFFYLDSSNGSWRYLRDYEQ